MRALGVCRTFFLPLSILAAQVTALVRRATHLLNSYNLSSVLIALYYAPAWLVTTHTRGYEDLMSHVVPSLHKFSRALWAISTHFIVISTFPSCLIIQSYMALDGSNFHGLIIYSPSPNQSTSARARYMTQANEVALTC